MIVCRGGGGLEKSKCRVSRFAKEGGWPWRVLVKFQDSHIDPWPQYFENYRNTSPICFTMLVHMHALLPGNMYNAHLHHDPPHLYRIAS